MEDKDDIYKINENGIWFFVKESKYQVSLNEKSKGEITHVNGKKLKVIFYDGRDKHTFRTKSLVKVKSEKDRSYLVVYDPDL